MWRIWNSDFQRLVVRTYRRIGEVLQWNIKDDADRTPFFNCGEQGRCRRRITEEVAKFQRVDQTGAVLDFTVESDDGCFPVGFERCPQRFHHSWCQEFSELWGDFVDPGIELLHEPLALPGVFNDRSDHGRACHGVDGFPTLGENRVDAGGNFAKLHQEPSSKIASVTAGSVFRSPMRGCGRGPSAATAITTISSACGASGRWTSMLW